MSKIKNQYWGFKDSKFRDSPLDAWRQAEFGRHNTRELWWALMLVILERAKTDRGETYFLVTDRFGTSLGHPLGRPLSKSARSTLIKSFYNRAESIRNNILHDIVEAIITGDRAPFDRFAAAVEFIKFSGTLNEVRTKWADELAHQIVEYGEGFGSIFNIDKFMNDPRACCSQDRKTVGARVRALGYKVQTGRPIKRKT